MLELDPTDVALVVDEVVSMGHEWRIPDAGRRDDVDTGRRDKE